MLSSARRIASKMHWMLLTRPSRLCGGSPRHHGTSEMMRIARSALGYTGARRRVCTKSLQSGWLRRSAETVSQTMSQMLGAERIVKRWSLIDLICSYLILFDFPKHSVRLHDLQTDAKGLTSPCNSYQCHLQGNLNKMLVLATNHQQRLKIKAMEILKSKSRCPSIWMLKAKVNALHADAWDAAMGYVNQLWCVKMYQKPSRSKASRPLALPGDSQLFHRVRRENIQHTTQLVPMWRDIQSNCAAPQKGSKGSLERKGKRLQHSACMCRRSCSQRQALVWACSNWQGKGWNSFSDTHAFWMLVNAFDCFWFAGPVEPNESLSASGCSGHSQWKTYGAQHVCAGCGLIWTHSNIFRKN